VAQQKALLECATCLLVSKENNVKGLDSLITHEVGGIIGNVTVTNNAGIVPTQPGLVDLLNTIDQLRATNDRTHDSNSPQVLMSKGAVGGGVEGIDAVVGQGVHTLKGETMGKGGAGGAVHRVAGHDASVTVSLNIAVESHGSEPLVLISLSSVTVLLAAGLGHPLLDSSAVVKVLSSPEGVGSNLDHSLHQLGGLWTHHANNRGVLGIRVGKSHVACVVSLLTGLGDSDLVLVLGGTCIGAVLLSKDSLADGAPTAPVCMSGVEAAGRRAECHIGARIAAALRALVA